MIAQQLKLIQKSIQDYALKYQRDANDIKLIAVTKQQSLKAIQTAIECGQTDFAESYVQEAINKITTLHNPKLIWHFIGPIQSNKTRDIAAHFSWVHSLDRLKIAERLNIQRPNHLSQLNVCIEVNIDDESSKAGVKPNEVLLLARQIDALPKLKLRGLMTIPKPTVNFNEQRQAFAKLRELQGQLKHEGFLVDTLSIGMSDDLEAAIAEGATCVRIGRAIFGSR